MKYQNEEKISAEEMAVILSQTIKDVMDRKTTLRQAMVIARLTLALCKTIETVELKNRVEFIEQFLKNKR